MPNKPQGVHSHHSNFIICIIIIYQFKEIRPKKCVHMMFKFLKKWYMSRCVAAAAEAADITHLASDLVEHFLVLNHTTCRVAHALLKKHSTLHLFYKLDIARLATHPESLEYSHEQWKLLAHMARMTFSDDNRHFGCHLWTGIFTHPKLSGYAMVVAAELCPERAFSQDQQQRIMQEFQSVYAETDWRYYVTSEKIYNYV